MRGPVSRSATLAALAAAALAAGLAFAADTAPPSVTALEPRISGDRLVFGARVRDDSSVTSVTLWLRGEKEVEFRSVRMGKRTESEYEAVLPRASVRGSWLGYYVEATDTAGNPPAHDGDRGRPYVFRMDGTAPHAAAESEVALLVVLLAAVVALVILLVRRVRQRRRAGARGAAPARHSGPPLSLAHAGREQLLEDLFWFRLLSPLLDRPDAERERALRELASRAHVHPTRGRRIFPIGKLRQRLVRVGRIDRDELLERAEALDGPQRRKR